MASFRLVLGIINIVLSLWVFIQSFVVNVASNFDSKFGNSGGLGGLFAICFLISGIVLIVNHKKNKPSVVTGALFLLLGFIGATDTGSWAVYKDLMVYDIYSFALGIIFILHGILYQRGSDKTATEATGTVEQKITEKDSSKPETHDEDRIKALEKELQELKSNMTEKRDDGGAE